MTWRQLGFGVVFLLAILDARAIHATTITFASANTTLGNPSSDTDSGTPSLESFTNSEDGIGGDGVGRATLNPGILTASAHGCGVVSGGTGAASASFLDFFQVVSGSLPAGTPVTLTFSVAMAGKANGFAAETHLSNFGGGNAEGTFSVGHSNGADSVTGRIVRDSAGADVKTGLMTMPLGSTQAGQTLIVIPGILVGHEISIAASISASASGVSITNELASGEAMGSLLFSFIDTPGIMLISRETGQPLPGGYGVSAGDAVDAVPPNPLTLIPVPEPGSAVLLMICLGHYALSNRPKA